MKETECPCCGAMNDISETEDYEIINCYNCKTDIEYFDEELHDNF